VPSHCYARASRAEGGPIAAAIRWGYGRPNILQPLTMSGRHRVGRWLGSGTAARSRTTTLATKSGWRVNGFRDDDGVTHRVQRIGPADEHDKHGRLADEALIANLEKLLVLAGQ